METIGHSERPWYDYADSILKVVIEDGVTGLGENAFSHIENLSEVTIPDSVTSIGVDAFVRCYSLTHLTIPAGITVIPEGAFAYSGLTSIEIPSGVTYYYKVIAVHSKSAANSAYSLVDSIKSR